MTTPASPSAGTPARVTIYTSSDCHWCGKAKDYLTQRGVGYTEKDVEADEAVASEAIALSGQRGTPVITVGSRVIVGFQRRLLDQALDLGAMDARREAAAPIAQDTLGELIASKRITPTPAQAAQAAAFRVQVDASALCGYLGQALDYFPGNCDDTFRHTRAFLAAGPHAADVDPLLDRLRSAGVPCDCAYAINMCR
ncbi:MAG TPA: glutaredoxin family protein [Chloroflexia bacterium]|nr:glutaredoxin family protein [Chloroflexia bacterium]